MWREGDGPPFHLITCKSMETNRILKALEWIAAAAGASGLVATFGFLIDIG